MWVACGISMCSVEVADGYYCEPPPGNILFFVNLQARSGFQSLSLPWEMSYKKQQGKALQKKKKKIQRIRAGEYRITACIFSLHFQSGAYTLRRGSENVLEQNLEKVQSKYHHQECSSSVFLVVHLEHRKMATPSPLRSGVASVGQGNMSGSDMSHFWVEVILPAFAVVPSKTAGGACPVSSGLRAAKAQPTCDRHTVRKSYTFLKPLILWLSVTRS